MSVYASNDPRARSVMWHEIVDALLVVDSWIVGGDFNNVECAQDVRGVIPSHLIVISSR
eukprot:c31459_g1_i1 orf=66-242(+)